jgi:hypothetical protein
MKNEIFAARDVFFSSAYHPKQKGGINITSLILFSRIIYIFIQYTK